MAEGRRKFSDEFKREAVMLATQPGVTVSSVARDLGVDVSVLRRWVEKSRGGKWEAAAGKPLKSETAAELERVKRELAKVKMERDILKKALGYFAKDPT
jgi:transposase